MNDMNNDDATANTKSLLEELLKCHRVIVPQLIKKEAVKVDDIVINPREGLKSAHDVFEEYKKAYRNTFPEGVKTIRVRGYMTFMFGGTYETEIAVEGSYIARGIVDVSDPLVLDGKPDYKLGAYVMGVTADSYNYNKAIANSVGLHSYTKIMITEDEYNRLKDILPVKEVDKSKGVYC